MRRRWYILSVLAGALAAIVVWAWPVRPLWRSGSDAGRIEGFSPDSQTLVTCHVPPVTGGRYPNPEVLRWDAATGKLVSRVEIPCADPFSMKEVRPSADGGTVLVGEVLGAEATRSDFGTGDWYLHDGVTGQRRTGPVPGVAAVGPAAFSPDGRWFVGIHGPSHGGIDSIRGRDIFSAATGELVLGLPDHDGLLAVGCFFAQDGSTVAVDWIPDNKKNNVQHTIQVFELPSSRERHRFELPLELWRRINNWDGRLLEAIKDVPTGACCTNAQSCVFDLSDEPVGDGFEDPLLGNNLSGADYWVNGPDWVAYYTAVGSPRGLPAGVPHGDWLAAQLGLKRVFAGELREKVRIVDRATGATRSGLLLPFGEIEISPDAHRIGCPTVDGGVEVWDTNPQPGWPWALAAGVTAAGGVLGIGRWRRSQARQLPMQPCSKVGESQNVTTGEPG